MSPACLQIFEHFQGLELKSPLSLTVAAVAKGTTCSRGATNSESEIPEMRYSKVNYLFCCHPPSLGLFGVLCMYQQATPDLRCCRLSQQRRGLEWHNSHLGDWNCHR